MRCVYKKEVKENRFYVYGLIDPRNQIPFFIGKTQSRDKYGNKSRTNKDHLLCKENQSKIKIIKEIEQEGLQVGTKIFKENMSEEESFNFKRELIKSYGQEQNGTGVLTNILKRNQGITGVKFSKLTKKKMSESAKI